MDVTRTEFLVYNFVYLSNGESESIRICETLLNQLPKGK